ncbi:MAG TPA: hypothetical protein VKR60_13765 [Candidatus Sulfotelmatobacter sp.]|nr:hypothetical protein [Candidatus Sulfotelmatobacter sp.]
MNAKWFGIVALIAVATLLFNLSSCGYNQHLVSLTIAPAAGAQFGGVDPALFVDFTATGTYEHPPHTKDMTTLVTWKSDTPQVAQVSTGGVVTPNTNCGAANVTATFYDSPNLVASNSAHIVVDGPAADGCTPAGPQPILTVDITGAGTGTVSDSTGVLNCIATCSATFAIGSTVTLNAAPNAGSTFASWSGCNQSTGPTCEVFMQNNVTVTATFN